MSDVSAMTPRERSAFMVDRIRSGEPAPYEEGRYVLRVASAPGRISGQPRAWAIAVIQVDGHHYIAAPNRRRDWVRNLLANGDCHLEQDEQPDRHAFLVEDDSAATIVETYLGVLGRPSTMWPFPNDASASRIADHLGEIAVLRLDPA